MSRTGVQAGLGCREAFPLLAADPRLVYLDTAATAQRPAAVLDALDRYHRHHNANVHRGLYGLAERATGLYEGCRKRVAAWLGLPAPEGVVITSGATASLNLVARGLAGELDPDAEILLTVSEHHANLVPWIMVARERGCTLRHIPLTEEGDLDLDAAERLLGPRTRVLALSLASNVLGTINPVARLAALARERGALVVVDAAQAVGRLPVSFAVLGADLLAFSAHKCYGPMGLGFLVGRSAALEQLVPVWGGGEMINQVELDAATWNEVPWRFEAGTPNVAAAAAFKAALNWLDGIGLERIREHEIELSGRLLERLDALDGVTILGPRDPRRRVGLVSFTDRDAHPHDLATLLDGEGFAIRAGHHCAQPLHRELGLVATVRASFGVHTNLEEIDRFVEALDRARRMFRR